MTDKSIMMYAVAGMNVHEIKRLSALHDSGVLGMLITPITPNTMNEWKSSGKDDVVIDAVIDIRKKIGSIP